MTDQCMHCTVRGDIDACMKTPCSQHESWYAQTLKALAKQEQGEPLPDFYITEKMADSIYKLKSPDWALCISGNKHPTMHKNIPVFVGYIKTKPVEQEQGEPVAIIHRNEYNEYRLEPHDSFDIKSIPFNVDVLLFKGKSNA